MLVLITETLSPATVGAFNQGIIDVKKNSCLSGKNWNVSVNG